MGPPSIYMEDSQTDGKSSRWAFTAYEGQYHLFATVMPEVIAEIGWQTEICPTTGNNHYQGFIRTSRQVRFAQLKKIFPGVNLGVARNWDALLNYCRKSETAVPGTQVHIRNETDHVPPAMTMPQALTYFAANYPYEASPDYSELTGQRLADYKESMFWKTVNNCLANDRKLIGLYHQPQYIRCWKHTASQWLEDAVLLAEFSEQTDRQTDNPEFSGPAFEN